MVPKTRTSHLFHIIFGNNKFSIGLSDLQECAANTKIALNFIRWIKTVDEDEKSKFKRLKMLAETKYSKSFSNDFS